MMDPAASHPLLDAFRSVEATRFAPIAAQALAPAFLLSACAAILSFLMNRLWRILDQYHAREGARETPEARAAAARMLARARLIYRAIHSTTGAALATAGVVLVVFVNSVIGMEHEWGSALLFLLAIGLIAHAFVCLLLEVRIAMLDFGALLNAPEANAKPPE